ncbi:hypothetical protein H072_4347 [Dactylellina haptotyla CBS 200.50]|uniref:Uncharacterized protein n=1 Tax=Dactylellina haptotyla (strain CBS 200.50) TaxID=1284197 RepID=S8BQM1_DACHA|nr:hypothetical protein H072_4347 [Dactylellina haptotyla CBS 200.50]
MSNSSSPGLKEVIAKQLRNAHDHENEYDDTLQKVRENLVIKNYEQGTGGESWDEFDDRVQSSEEIQALNKKRDALKKKFEDELKEYGHDHSNVHGTPENFNLSVTLVNNTTSDLKTSRLNCSFGKLVGDAPITINSGQHHKYQLQGDSHGISANWAWHIGRSGALVTVASKQLSDNDATFACTTKSTHYTITKKIDADNKHQVVWTITE